MPKGPYNSSSVVTARCVAEPGEDKDNRWVQSVLYREDKIMHGERKMVGDNLRKREENEREREGVKATMHTRIKLYHFNLVHEIYGAHAG